MKISLAILTAAAAILIHPLAATAAEKTEAVKFKAGTTSATIKGSIKGDDYINYALEANAGQVMSILFSPSNPSCYFNLLPPGSDEAIHIGSSVGNEFGGTLGVIRRIQGAGLSDPRRCPPQRDLQLFHHLRDFGRIRERWRGFNAGRFRRRSDGRPRSLDGRWGAGG